MYKIRKQIDFLQLSPKLACKVFDSVTIYYYITQRFGGHTKTAHLKFSKLYYGVNRKASNAASRGELEKFPLLFPVIKTTLSYINNLFKTRVASSIP